MKRLDEFYKLMHDTIDPRKEAVKSILANSPVNKDITDSLKETLKILEAIPTENGRQILELDEETKITLEMDYEIDEIKKDLFFIENGETPFLSFLDNIHPEFTDNCKRVTEYLKAGDYTLLVSDRDGTVNNYCGRYGTSIQSIYNAVFLAKYAKKIKDAVILTSAPLDNIGLADISVSPENAFIFAGSKGREYFNKNGKRCQLAIDEKRQRIMQNLNSRLDELTRAANYKKFTLIGSGLQYKFGQTTLARQDISESIPADESEALLKRIEDIISEVDPEKKYLKIEDTGKDIEVLLTVEDSGDGKNRDFDKGDGIRFLNDDADLGISKEKTLICGDTNSDVPMITAAKKINADSGAVFVTEDAALKEKVLKECPDAVFAPTPDVLVTALYLTTI